MEKVRLGIVGLGNMGAVHVKQHAPAMQRAELTAICDVVAEKMAPFEGVAKFEDSRDLIRSGLVDAVLIATPHYDHTTVGIDAFQNGLHVLTEKPISAHKADAERLSAAKRPGLVFSAMFQLRTASVYQAIKKLIDEGELGEIRRVNWIITNWFRTAAYYSSGGWRATWGGEGGGILLNQCPHNLDLYQWFFGMPSSIRAFCGFGKFHDIEVEDSVTAYLQHPNGATAVLVATTGEAPGTDRLEVAGDRGRLVLEGGRLTFDRTTESVQDYSDTTSEMFPNMPTWKCEIPTGRQGAHHLTIIQNFIDAILDGKPLVAPGEEGIRSVELANAMLLSSWTSESVQLPMDGAVYERALKEKIANSTHRKVVDEKTAADMAASFH
ncbi:MAG TPA: Gfo/Idh/MocA family oxidoreductase [Fimbriimonas sp.]|nr:Gfo/Idh/MocA family oxidoreductase [Fimbriimonas sp.]